MPSVRKIIHVDMDAFYASIEQRDNPEYRGRPLAVGYAGERGVVAAASYEARKWGVRSAMSSRAALQRCPHLLFVPARFEVYRDVSMQIRRIFMAFTDFVEPLSLDEAFLDVTDNRFGVSSATILAREIKRRILAATGLTASAGVSINKFLAKIASDYDKPDGLFVIPPEEAESFAASLKIEQFWGVGRVTAEKMHRLGIHTGADLKACRLDELVGHFGKAGHTYYWNARAVDDRPVEPNRERKSLGSETTFAADIGDRHILQGFLAEICGEVWERISKNGAFGRTVTLKIKYADFEEISRRTTLARRVDGGELLLEVASGLLDIVDVERKKVRLMGVTVSNFAVPTGFRQRELGLDDAHCG